MEANPKRKCRYCGSIKPATLIESHREQCRREQQEHNSADLLKRLRFKESLGGPEASFWKELADEQEARIA